MKHLPHGILLEKAELRALLEFTPRNPEDPRAVVHFRTEGTTVTAYATDGKRCIQADGFADDGVQKGEWSVFRDFLVACHKLIGGGQHLVLEVTGASLNRAYAQDTETMDERASMTWPIDAAATQQSLPIEGLQNLVILPTHSTPARCVSVPAGQIGALSIVGKATGVDGPALDIYPPENRLAPLIFRVDGPIATWTGAISQMGAPESTEDVDEEDGESPSRQLDVFGETEVFDS